MEKRFIDYLDVWSGNEFLYVGFGIDQRFFFDMKGFVLHRSGNWRKMNDFIS